MVNRSGETALTGKWTFRAARTLPALGRPVQSVTFRGVRGPGRGDNSTHFLRAAALRRERPRCIIPVFTAQGLA